MSAMFKPSKQVMNDMVQQCLGDEYTMLGSVCLQATHMAVFISHRLSLLVSDLSTETVATGFKGMMGNKGAVMIKFKLLDQELLFINCHLHSGLNGVSNRNSDIAQIMTRFVYRPSAKKTAIAPPQNPPDVIILMGDLNYRISGYKPSILQSMAQDHYDILLQHDQLTMESKLGNIPDIFKEGDIHFAPTFKRKPYDNNTFKLKRNPAWTDRILFHCDCEQQPCRLQLKSYDSNNMVNISDHRPVFA